MTSGYGFRIEVLVKYDLEVYEAFIDLFCALPIAGLLNNMIFLVHGGISSRLKTLADVNLIQRFREPPTKGILCDLLWSDANYDENEQHILPNSGRGCGILFNKSLLLEFLKRNNLICMIKAHEQCESGFKMIYWDDPFFPSLISVFSAPNYCDSYGNKAGLITIDDFHLNIKQYHASPHPFTLRNHENVFHWSAPFIISKVIQLLYVLLQKKNEKAEIFDEYLLDRVKEIDPNYHGTLREIKEYEQDNSSDSFVSVPEEEECGLNVPTISEYKSSLLFHNNSNLN